MKHFIFSIFFLSLAFNSLAQDTLSNHSLFNAAANAFLRCQSHEYTQDFQAQLGVKLEHLNRDPAEAYFPDMMQDVGNFLYFYRLSDDEECGEIIWTGLTLSKKKYDRGGLAIEILGIDLSEVKIGEISELMVEAGAEALYFSKTENSEVHEFGYGEYEIRFESEEEDGTIRHIELSPAASAYENR